MMSSLLLSFVKLILPSKNTTSLSTEPENVEEDVEQLPTKIITDNTGELVDTNQIHHYWHCGDTLSQMSFYDFSRFIKLRKNPKEAMLKILLKLILVFFSATC